MPTVLVVDDDPELRSSLTRLIARHGHRILQAGDAPDGVAVLGREAPDLVITDMEMPGGGGMVVLEAGMRAGVPVVILTAHASVEMAVEAMRKGAANFLTKPFSPETVGQVLQESFTARPPTPREVRRVPSPTTGSLTPVRAPAGPSIVGDDEAFTSVLSLVDRVADTDVSILVTGESGTGKEVVARAIHNASRRRDKPFVAVNCGALHEALLESELFGHVRGAFTGATQARRGRFSMAEGGTLFLDEIGDMPLSLQVKLLRVIQENQYEVLGDSRTVSANVRFIAATHRNLEKLVAEGRFRDDLYYRLNVVPLELPPLRERTRDIPLLVDYFIGEANAAHGRAITGVSREALAMLTAYPWPGNVRELSNVVERMVVLRAAGTIDVSDVPVNVRAAARGIPVSAANAARGVNLPPSGIDLGVALMDYEGHLIEQALERTHGNRTQAAALLRINRTTLVEKLKRREGGSESEEG